MDKDVRHLTEVIGGKRDGALALPAQTDLPSSMLDLGSCDPSCEMEA